MLRITLPTLAVVVIVALGLYMDAQSQTDAQVQVTPTGPIGVFAIGRVEGATREINLRPPITECVAEVLVSEGQLVQQGQPLVRLDDRVQRYELAQAQAALDVTKSQYERLKNGSRQEECDEVLALYHAKLAQLENARNELARVQQLTSDGVVSRRQTDDHESRVETLESEVRAAKARADLVMAPARPDDLRIAQARIAEALARVDLARARIDRAQLWAPVSGQVLKVNLVKGELVGPNMTEPALIMADTSRIHVRAFVEEMDAPRVVLGAHARVTADGLPGKKYTGRVIKLGQRMGRKRLRTDDPTERFDTKYRELWIELQDWQGLLIGLRVDITIDPAVNSKATAEQLATAN